jgi:hypothetical protein
MLVNGVFEGAPQPRFMPAGGGGGGRATPQPNIIILQDTSGLKDASNWYSSELVVRITSRILSNKRNQQLDHFPLEVT